MDIVTDRCAFGNMGEFLFCKVSSTQPTAAPLFVTVGYDTGLSATTMLAAEMAIAIYRLQCYTLKTYTAWRSARD